jgi:hypothetical protein
MTGPGVSFAEDIAPVFLQYRAQMMWRFDLTRYDDVKGNAAIINAMIQPPSAMPPPPFPPFSADFITLFGLWIDQHCPQ